MSLSLNTPTALLLIDNQQGFAVDPTKPSHWGTARSTPSFETNLKNLIASFRSAKSRYPERHLEVIHVFHSSLQLESHLHLSFDNGRGIQPIEFAKPASDDSEKVIWKSVNSAFIGTELEGYLLKQDIRQLILAGLTTDHCVSTTTRMAANLGVVDRFPKGKPVLNSDGSHEDVEVDKGRIVLVGDATATWAKGEFDADTVHAVSLASLDGEFADVLSTEEVVGALEGV
ncbi:putative isochorismatase family hydrolase [Aspergillus stella-maris]|uniref:putative isochorismatase family hydrolase n=1 Tax=Aspergillus stella-maris TaxID=1810926 RepID=UPI003CCCCACF